VQNPSGFAHRPEMSFEIRCLRKIRQVVPANRQKIEGFLSIPYGPTGADLYVAKLVSALEIRCFWRTLQLIGETLDRTSGTDLAIDFPGDSVCRREIARLSRASWMCTASSRGLCWVFPRVPDSQPRICNYFCRNSGDFQSGARELSMVWITACL
jgi:hypothetical protein